MADLKDILDLEKIEKMSEMKHHLQRERILNARLSGWEEMSSYISSMEESILETKNQMEEEGEFSEENVEYLLAQIDTLQMLKSFISRRVKLLSPEHPLAQKNKDNISAAARKTCINWRKK